MLGMAFVLSRLNLATLRDTLLSAQPSWLLFSFFLINISLVLRGYRWLLLLRSLELTVPFRRLVALYFVGNFFNAFLPTSFGGDVMRVVEVTRDVPPAVAAGTVIVDRLTGLIMLFVMALAALPWRPADFPGELVPLVVAVSAAGIGAGALLLHGELVWRAGRWLPRALSPAGDGPVAKMLQTVHACGWQAIAGALAVSLLFNLILMGWWWAAGRALGFDEVELRYYLLVIPILSITLLVPSIGGLGPREAAAPLLFQARLGQEEAVALSLLVFLLQRVAGLFGGPLYLWLLLHGGKRKNAIGSP